MRRNILATKLDIFLIEGRKPKEKYKNQKHQTILNNNLNNNNNNNNSNNTFIAQ